ncbi:MAG: carboxypeptidase-like regulatory domain-containing protein [Planctomycetota bacterium]
MRVPTDGLALTARKAGFDSEHPLGPRAGVLQLALRRRPTVPPDLTGVVRHRDGRAAPGAHVAFGRHRTTADARGVFGLTDKDWQIDSPLLAYTEGAQMEQIDGLGPRLDPDPNAGRSLVLELGPEPLEIRGRIVGADGAPAAGWQIHLLDGATSDGLAWGEHLVAAAPTLAPTTQDDGAFRVGGLSARAYRLRAIHRETLLTLDSAPIVAGAVNTELRVPRDALHAELEGIVLDRSPASRSPAWSCTSRRDPSAERQITAPCSPRSQVPNSPPVWPESSSRTTRHRPRSVRMVPT